jgi:hypothetical protein
MSRRAAFPTSNTGYESVEMEETTLLRALAGWVVARVVLLAAAGIAAGVGLGAAAVELWWPHA